MKIEWLRDMGNWYAFADNDCVASAQLGADGWWSNFKGGILNHLNPPTTTCKTEAGIKRRVEKYITLWVIAGRPE